MRSMESPDSSAGSVPPQKQKQKQQQQLQLRLGSTPELPPGFRFHPTDEELVVHYLKKKAASVPLPVTIIAEVDLYKFDPWELPAKATFGEHEWYFFSPRDRKYPNGARPNRAATSGYWKATGTDKPIMASGGSREKVGVKKALVFYRGKPPKGLKTNWIMHEYRLTDTSSSTTTPSRPPPGTGGSRAASLRLDDWVLCRIYKKITKAEAGGQQRSMDCEDSVKAAVTAYPPHATVGMASSGAGGGAQGGGDYTSLLHHDSHEDNFLDGLLTTEDVVPSAGASSLSQLAAAARATPAATKQLLAPSSTPFYWPDASTIAILPQVKNFSGFNRGRNVGNMSLSSTAERSMAGAAGTGAVDNGTAVNGADAMPAFINPLYVQAATYHQHHAILGTSLPPEATAAAACAFQHPFQISGVNWAIPE